MQRHPSRPVRREGRARSLIPDLPQRERRVVRREMEMPMTRQPPPMTPLLAGALVLGALCVRAACLPVFAADAATGAPPGLELSGPGVAWAGFVAPKQPDYAIAHAFNDFTS